MQKFIFETSPHKIGTSEKGYDFLRRHHGIPKMKMLRSADHRILIFRDPVERIRSLFVNKFVQRNANVDIFNSYKKVAGRDPEKATFRDFILGYVSRLGDVALDPHVWPQHWHLCPVVYDRVFPLNAVTEGMAQIIGPRMAAQFFETKVNPSRKLSMEIDSEMRARISAIYAEDFRMIERIA